MATFDGFISYSHSGDDRLAPALQAGLQRFAKPWWRRRALRVFRDQSGLSANPHLWASIETALADSEWFVLLCSPDAAASPWVGREIKWWLANRDPARVLPVLTSGAFAWDQVEGRLDVAASTAVPLALAEAMVTEPRWIDLRWADEAAVLDLRNPSFRAAVADVAAPLRGVAKDELESEEVHQHRRTMRTAKLAAGALVVLAVVAVAAGMAAARQRNEAQAQRNEARAQRNEAEAQRNEATAQRAEAVHQEQAAVDAAEREQVQRLSAQAGDLAGGRIDAALLLAVESSLRSPGPATDDVLLRAIADAGPLVGVGLLPVQDRSASFDPMGRVSMSAGDTWLRLVPGAVGAERITPRPGQSIISADVVGDGDRLIVSYGDGVAQILSLASGTVIAERQLAGPTILVALEDAVLGLVPSSSALSVLSLDDLADVDEVALPMEVRTIQTFGTIAFVVGFDGAVRLVGADGVGEPIALRSVPTTFSINTVTGDVYGGLDDGTVVAWNVSSQSAPETIASFDNRSAVSALAVAPDGDHLAIARDDGAVLILDLASGERKTITQVGEPIVSLAYDRSSKDLVAVSSSRWFRFRTDGRSPLARQLWAPADPALFPDAVEWADGRLYIAGPPGRIDVIDAEGRTEARIDVGENAVVPSIVVVDGSVIAAVVELPGLPLAPVKALQADAQVDTPTGIIADFVKPILQSSVVAADPVGGERWRTPMPDAVVSLIQVGDGRVVALDAAGAISVLDADTGEVLFVESAVLSTPGYRVRISGDVLVATGQGPATRSARLDVDAIERGEELLNASVYDAVDGAFLLSQGGSVGLAEPTTLDFTGPTVGTGGLEWDAHIVPDSDRIVLNDASTLWFARAGQTVARFGPSASIMVLVGAGPEQVVTMDFDGNLERWDIDRAHLRRLACRLVDRDLTDDEWAEFFPDEPHRSTCGAAGA